eukprot:6226577-Amphidinium_carterae.1
MAGELGGTATELLPVVATSLNKLFTLRVPLLDSSRHTTSPYGQLRVIAVSLANNGNSCSVSSQEKMLTAPNHYNGLRMTFDFHSPKRANRGPRPPITFPQVQPNIQSITGENTTKKISVENSGRQKLCRSLLLRNASMEGSKGGGEASAIGGVSSSLLTNVCHIHVPDDVPHGPVHIGLIGHHLQDLQA